MRDKRDEADVDEVEVGDPGERNLGRAPARQKEQLRRGLGLGAQRAHLVAGHRREREAPGEKKRKGQRLHGDKLAGGRQVGEERLARQAAAAAAALNLLVGRRR